MIRLGNIFGATETGVCLTGVNLTGVGWALAGFMASGSGFKVLFQVTLTIGGPLLVQPEVEHPGLGSVTGITGISDLVSDSLFLNVMT